MTPQEETTPEVDGHGPNFIRNDVKFSKRTALIFAGVFAVIGATLAYFLIFAAGNLPNSADEFVVKLEQEKPGLILQEEGEVKNPHAEFKTLILGDGSLYCSEVVDGNVQYREGTVTRGEIQSLVQTLKSNGITKEPEEGQEAHVGELTRITVNYGNEVVTNEVYSDEKPRAFQNAEERILESCTEATKVVDALPDYNSGLKKVPYEDPEDLDVQDADDFPEIDDVEEFGEYNTEEQASLSNSIKNTLKEKFAPEVHAGSYNTHYDLVHQWRINRERSSHSLNKLPKSHCLSVVAKRWSRYMARNNILKHNSNLASDVDRYCGTDNGTWYAIGENVGSGWSESGLFKAFLNSCGHEANINSKKGCNGSYGSRPWTYTGTGFYMKNNGSMYVTQIFVYCKGCNSGPWKPKATFRLKNALSGPYGANYYAEYGRKGYTPLTCDWNKNGRDTIGVNRGNHYYLRNSASTGGTHHHFRFGLSTDTPLCGDWNGNGKDTIGLKRGNSYHLDYWLNGGKANKVFKYYRSNDIPVSGDWNGDGKDSIGIFRTSYY